MYEWTADGEIPEEFQVALGNPRPGHTVTTAALNFMQAEGIWEDARSAGTIMLTAAAGTIMPAQPEIRYEWTAEGEIPEEFQEALGNPRPGHTVTTPALNFMHGEGIFEDALSAGTILRKVVLAPEVNVRVRSLQMVIDGIREICCAGDLGTVTRITDGRMHIFWDRTGGQSSMTEKSWAKCIQVKDQQVASSVVDAERNGRAVRFHLTSGDRVDVDLRMDKCVAHTKRRIAETLGLDQSYYSMALVCGCDVLENRASWRKLRKKATSDIDVMVVLTGGFDAEEGFTYKDKPVSKLVRWHGKDDDMFLVYYKDEETEVVTGSSLIPNSSMPFI